MVEVHDAVVDEAAHEGSAMTVDDLVSLVERHHDDRPGVSREALAAYAERLASRGDVEFDADAFLAEVDDRTTDAGTWTDGDVFYPVASDRISRFPARWHENLGGSTDVAAYLRYVRDEAPAFASAVGRSDQAEALPESELLDVVSTVGRVDRDEAKEAIEAARDRGDVVEGADQHPGASVFLAEEAEGMRDETLDR